jgi:hypothetical protein
MTLVHPGNARAPNGVMQSKPLDDRGHPMKEFSKCLENLIPNRGDDPGIHC